MLRYEVVPTAGSRSRRQRKIVIVCPDLQLLGGNCCLILGLLCNQGPNIAAAMIGLQNGTDLVSYIENGGKAEIVKVKRQEIQESRLPFKSQFVAF
eukprot:2499398-Amphidinium_carterae.1